MPDIFAFGPDRFQTPLAISQMAAGHCGGRAVQSAAQAVFDPGGRSLSTTMAQYPGLVAPAVLLDLG